ncbi:alpha/beta fold hydrolase [Mycolicibacterium arseniciresistens]|uniref:Alpha/beta hydrolase n=1 Tax=Mycolicibacterium arseniciresistens TaxID=3062257 RepID=A0ABT8UND1_9MYCO|nr:alpha/beta hydrolase [Mycolicibacterium arseniciresistens]MDO3638305.1 alpha/beta hydrolase [Mycolicibacterium arseniciresistens]
MSIAPEDELSPNAFRSGTPGGDGPVERIVVTSDGVRLSVRDHRADQSDAPTVVLLHGLLLSQQSWSPQVRRLRRRWGGRVRIITYDHRGHGCSAAAPMTTYRIDRLAADLADILAASDITGPLTIAGHSMGGMTALAYLARPAADRPVDPRALVLVGTAAGGLAGRGMPRLLATPATGALFGLVGRMPTVDAAVQAIMRPLGDALGMFAGDDTTVSGVTAAAVRRTLLSTAAGFLPSLRSYDVTRSLGSITAKTFVVSGGADILTPAAHSREMAAAIPGAVHLHHPTAGHLLLQEAAECVSDVVGRAMEMRRATSDFAPGRKKRHLTLVAHNAQNADIAACGR